MISSLNRLVCGLLAALALTLLPTNLFAQEEKAEPAPKAASSQLVEVAGNDTKIETVIAMINEQIDNKVMLFGKTSGARVTVLADGVPVEDVLSMMANPNGWIWWKMDNGDYGLADRAYYEKEILPKQVVQRTYRPNNVKASELERAIKGLLTPNVGNSVSDDRTNKLIVNDLPPALERIERFIREIDVQLIVRLFYIRHADVEDIAKKLESYKSGPGTIEVDKKTHQIIVTDLLSNIKKMELLIDILDVGPEIVIYDINNVGIDGEDLEDLQKIIETIRTEDLLFEVNEKQGVMILEDVPEVHERVEQILREFDRPVRQLLLQSEILSTSFNREFSFGVKNFALSEDLSASVTEGALSPGAGGVATGIGSFTNIRTAFPNVSMDENGTIGGNWLSSHAYFQLESVYKDSSTRVLLQPRLLVKNQEPSKIFVGKETPYLTTSYDDGGSNSNYNRSTTTQSTVQSGLKFEVTPSISNSYLIELELKIDNDDAFEVTDPTANRRLIGRDRQNVETTLQIPSGRTRIIGGLIKQNESDGSSGVPFLSSLPIIGAAFGTKSSSRNANNLMIFITPTVVEEDEVRFQEDGRRGRTVSGDDKLAGEYDLQFGSEDTEGSTAAKLLEGLNEGEMLSGSKAEEEEALRRLKEIYKRKQQEIEDSGGTNYQPGRTFGTTSLNVEEGGAPAAPPPNVQPEREIERPHQAGRPENQPPPAAPMPGNETQY